MTMRAFYRTCTEVSGERSREAVKRGTAAVLHTLRDRLTPAEAAQVAAQLPRELKRVWSAGETPGRRPVRLNREAFLLRVRTEAGLPSAGAARWMTLGVFAALKAQLTPGEAEDVLAQLPKDLKELWAEPTEAPVRRR
jgi:uncharacterized protein (DUF2267 family)